MPKTNNKKDEIKDVQPIRSLDKIEDMIWSLKKWCGQRDYILFLVGIHTGLRIGDLLNLKVIDVRKRNRITVWEGKSKKPRLLQLDDIYEEINDYICNIEGSEWLFPSRKGNESISRVQAYRQLNKAASMVDMEEGIGTHTMRKTFGYWHYKQFKNVAELQLILNHHHPKETLKYIGFTDKQIANNLHNFVVY